MTLEICSQCHPFFSGKQIYVDTAGRVEKFQRRYGSLTGAKQETAAPEKKEAQEQPEKTQKEQPEPVAAVATTAAPAKAKKSASARTKGATKAKAKKE